MGRNSQGARAAQLHQRARNGPAYDYQILYSRREGAPLRGWAGGTRDAGRRRGPRRHPGPSARHSLAQNPPSLVPSPSLPCFLPRPPEPLARTLAPPLPRPPLVVVRSVIPSRFSPALAIAPTDALYFGLILSHLSSYSFTLLFFLTLPILYRVLLSHSLFPVSLCPSCASRFLHRVSSASRVVDSAERQRRFLR